MKNIFTLILFFSLPLVGQVQVNTALHEEDRELYDKYFDQAGTEFGVPADILRGISFSETRWTHMKWNDDDKFSACNGMPRVYGVMGLWDNDYFGHSLIESAKLIGRTPQELKESPLQNIRGAAALMKKYYSELRKPPGIDENSLESWQNAIAKFSGIPQEELSNQRGVEVYSILSTGYSRDKIIIPKRDIKLEKIVSIVRASEVNKPDKAEGAMNQPDYPLAKWNPAYSGNFGTTLIQQKFVVIHDVEGSYLGCISWFKNPSAVVSAQYVLNSHPNGVNSTTKGPNGTPDAPVGEVTQMVEEKYRAYHVGCWNSYMVGIEHEGYASVSGWYTPECYDASAKLVKYLCDKYNIPKDRNHIIAHAEHQNATWRNWVTSSGQGFDPTCNTHTDPGPYWTWASYMTLVTSADTIRPVVTNALPQSDLNAFPAYKEIVVEFNTNMDITSANAAFSITPNISGTKNWSADNKILTFKPGALLPWSTLFTVKIDTSAKNVAKSRNLGVTPYTKTFTTVPLDTVGPAMVRSYPLPNETGVSSFTDVVVTLNEPVMQSSLSSTVKFVDENNVNVSLSGAKNEIVFDRGIVSFTPVNLKPNKTYTVKLLAGLKDIYNNISKTDNIFQFTTTPESYISGIPLDNLDANTKGWQQPYQSNLTQLVDSAKTALTFTNEKIKSGSGAARLAYRFSSVLDGVIEIKATGFPPIDSYTSVGIWISGDASNSTVELHFSPGNQVLNIGKIFWRGWKFIQYPIAEIAGPNKILTSIVMKQDSGFTAESKVYFDEMQLDASVTGIRTLTTSTPKEFNLTQNYPNPFNPGTTISFFITQTGFVSLKIYDLLGKEVSTIVSEVKNAGGYEVIYNASHLTSGVYYYTMRSGKFNQTRKMVFLK